MDTSRREALVIRHPAADAHPGDRRPTSETARLLGGSVLAAGVGVLPALLLGSLAVLIRQDIGFTSAQLGLTLAVFYTASLLVALPSGMVSERIGPRAAITIGLGASGLAGIGMAIVGVNWQSIAAVAVLGGVGQSFAQTGANHLLAVGITPRHQGLAFGVKQSAVPLAGIASGLMVPLIGLPLGWRWAFALPPLTAAMAIMLMRHRVIATPAIRVSIHADPPLGTLLAMTIGAGLGTAAGNGLAAFTVGSSVAHGLTLTEAGLVLTLGGCAGAATRIGVGWMADHLRWGSLQLAAWLLGGGALGCIGLAVFAGSPLLMTACTMVAFAGAWGYQGLVLLATARTSRTAPATALSVMRMGPAFGAIVGPLGIGLVVESHGYPLAWGLTGMAAACGAVVILLARRLLRRHTFGW